MRKTLTHRKKVLILRDKKSATVQQRFTLVYSSKKATCTFGGGGCFFNAFVSDWSARY